jgi:hypothetical protein
MCTYLHVRDGDTTPLRDDLLDRFGGDRVAGERLATLGTELAFLVLLLLLELLQPRVQLGNGIVAQVGGGGEAGGRGKSTSQSEKVPAREEGTSTHS